MFPGPFGKPAKPIFVSRQIFGLHILHDTEIIPMKHTTSPALRIIMPDKAPPRKENAVTIWQLVYPLHRQMAAPAMSRNINALIKNVQILRLFCNI